jgi:uncharacterized RDD family membrane protein YckC
MDRKSLLTMGPRRARLARLAAKLVDFALVFGAAWLSYPWGLAAGLAYLATGDALFDGQSVGKKWFGFRVVSLEDGRACSVRQSVVRNLPLVVPLCFAVVPLWGWLVCALLALPLALLEAYFLFKLDSAHRLGDVMADTTVVRSDPDVVMGKVRHSWFEERKTAPM